MVNANELIGILESEKESYQRLLEISKRKQDLIVKGDTDGLSDAVKAAERAMLAVCELEKKRVALVSPNLRKVQTQSPPELSSIVTSFSEPDANRALKLRDEMVGIIGELERTNKTNAELIKRSINYVHFVLGAIVQEDSVTYGNTPKPQSSNLRLIDGRA